ncbi:hypothetical protein AB0903_14760 [Streptomyces sp. NPDC048389]|uniref:hypothetical protein n=1 Tax=Streptomyces sp. NPDC048389 TaxID=3154622 RepID=UPI0034566B4F
MLGDSAYGTGDLREQLTAQGHVLVVKPLPLRTAMPGGFTIDDFHIDTKPPRTAHAAPSAAPQ